MIFWNLELLSRGFDQNLFEIRLVRKVHQILHKLHQQGNKNLDHNPYL